MPIPYKVFVFSKDKKEDYHWRPKNTDKLLDKIKSKIKYEDLISGPFYGCNIANIQKFAILLDREDLFFLISDISSDFKDSFGRNISITGLFHFKKNHENLLWILNVIKKLVSQSLKGKEDLSEKKDVFLKDLAQYLYDCFKENKEDGFSEPPAEKDSSDFNSINNLCLLQKNKSGEYPFKFFKLININSGEILKCLFSKELYSSNDLIVFSGDQINEILIKSFKIPVIAIGKSLIKTEGENDNIFPQNNIIAKIFNSGKKKI